MISLRIDGDRIRRRLARLRQRRPHRLDVSDGDALVQPAILPQHRRLQRGRLLHHAQRLQRRLVADQPPVKGDARIQLRTVRGVEPYDPPSPAEAGNAPPGRISTMLACPVIGRIDVGHHLRIGRLRHDAADQLLDIGDLGRIAMTGKQIGRDRIIAFSRKATAHVADPFMDAEYLMHHNDDRRVLRLFRPRHISGHGKAITRRDRNRLLR